MLPERFLVKGPPGLLEPDLLDELVGATNERLNVFRCAHRDGGDGAIRARQRFGAPLGNESRPGGAQQD